MMYGTSLTTSTKEVGDYFGGALQTHFMKQWGQSQLPFPLRTDSQFIIILYIDATENTQSYEPITRNLIFSFTHERPTEPAIQELLVNIPPSESTEGGRTSLIKLEKEVSSLPWPSEVPEGPISATQALELADAIRNKIKQDIEINAKLEADYWQAFDDDEWTS